MANATIPLVPVLRPSLNALRIKRPVEAGWMSCFTAAALQLVGARFRRAAHQIVTWPEGDYALDTDATVRTHTDLPVRVLWRASHGCEYAAVAITYQSSGEIGSQVTAATYTTAGAVQDAGFLWRLADGTLPASSSDDPSEDAYPIMIATTGAATHTGTGVGVSPRPLIIGAANRGAMVEARLTPVNTRLISVSVWELYRTQVAE